MLVSQKAATAMPPAVLFDIDGVILRAPSISRLVERRAAQFIQQRAKLPAPTAAQVNRALYSTYGHTLIGARRVLRMEASVDEYNEFVYSSAFLDHCWHELAAYRETSAGAKAMHVVQDLMQRSIPVYLFTNAPTRWANLVVDALALDIDGRRRISSDVGMKPEPETYALVTKVVKKNDGARNILFVDDALKNLEPVLDAPNWRTCLFMPTNDATEPTEPPAAAMSDTGAPFWMGDVHVARDLSEIRQIATATVAAN